MMNAETDIDEVVLCALADIQKTFPKLAERLMEGEFFLTRVSPDGTSQHAVTIVDFTRELTYDPVNFMNTTQYLYTSLASIDEWYSC